VVEADPLETAFRAGAVAALRRRASRQAQLAANGTIVGESGVIFRTGEGVLADRLAAAFSQLADELERGSAS
jgi:hypothetical protein